MGQLYLSHTHSALMDLKALQTTGQWLQKTSWLESTWKSCPCLEGAGQNFWLCHSSYRHFLSLAAQQEKKGGEPPHLFLSASKLWGRRKKAAFLSVLSLPTWRPTHSAVCCWEVWIHPLVKEQRPNPCHSPAARRQLFSEQEREQSVSK